MNKVYQVIWSRVRHCYMAVAETVARSHYKHSSKSAAKATWAAVAAAGLLTGIPAFSMAQGSTIAAPNQVVRTAEGRVFTKDTGKVKKAETPVFSNEELKKLTDRVIFPMNFMSAMYNNSDYNSPSESSTKAIHYVSVSGDESEQTPDVLGDQYTYASNYHNDGASIVGVKHDTWAIAIGRGATASNSGAIAIGSDFNDVGDQEQNYINDLLKQLRRRNPNQRAETGGYQSGYGTKLYEYAPKNVSLWAIAIGSGAQTWGQKNISIGYAAHTIGRDPEYDERQIAIGDCAVTLGDDSIATGTQARADGKNSIAYGYHSWAELPNSVAIGADSHVPAIGENKLKQAYLLDKDTFLLDNGFVSFGKDAYTDDFGKLQPAVNRRIIHVAGGAEDTDAVNVKQLKVLAAMYTPTDKLGDVINQKLGDTYAKKTDIPKAVDLSKYTPTDQLGDVIDQKLGDTYAKKADIPKAVDLSKYTPTDQLGTVIEQKLGDTYAKKTDIPAAKTFKAVGDGISVTEKDNVVTYTLDTSKLPQSSTGVYVTEQRYNNDLKGEHIALGEGSVAVDQRNSYSGLFAAGINAIAGGKDAIAIGNKASATGNTFSIAIGSNAEAPMSNSIALGEGSIANLTLSQQGKQSYLTKEDWNGDYNGVLSLGRDLSGARAAVNRRIIHVAGGAEDTDAVNVKQLKALAAMYTPTDKLGDVIAQKLGDTYAKKADIPKAVDLSKYTPTDQLGAVIEQKLGDTYAKKADIPAAVDLSKYTPTDKLGDVINQKLGDTYAKKADIPAAKTFKVAGAGFSVEDKDNVVTYTLDINKLKTQLSGSSSAGTNGKSAYEVWEEYTDGNGAQPNKGKKESDFLASLKGKDGTNGTNGKSAYEVWEEHKDVNGAQPNKGKSESDFLASLKGKDGTNGITAAQLEQVSQGMQTRMAALGKHMNSMGAGNAALAALHPLEFDPDDKLEAAVGVGHYGDANAAALGMFYHPDENTLISVGGAFGKDKNVMNAGISFRVGKGGNGMLLTKTALATAVKQQNIVIHQQEERIRQLERENKARDAKLAEVLQALAQVKR